MHFSERLSSLTSLASFRSHQADYYLQSVSFLLPCLPLLSYIILLITGLITDSLPLLKYIHHEDWDTVHLVICPWCLEEHLAYSKNSINI